MRGAYTHMSSETPEYQYSESVMEGIRLIKVPLPDNPLRMVNAYLILDDERPVLVDVGFNRVECEEALSLALGEFGLTFADVDVLITHNHPDHTGCLQRIWHEDMRVYAHLHSFMDTHILMDMEKRTYLPIVNVVSEEATARRRPTRELSVDLMPIKRDLPIIYLRNGDTFERGRFKFQVITTPGHHITHICLYEPTEKIMLTGDHVLERITPNISSFFLETDVLDDFIRSLDRVRDYDVRLVLPAHGDVFEGLARRVDELKAHHYARLNEMEDLVRAGHHDIIDITANASWKYPNWYSWNVDQKFFSLGETLAHLVHAVHLGILKMTITGTIVEFGLADE